MAHEHVVLLVTLVIRLSVYTFGTCQYGLGMTQLQFQASPPEDKNPRVEDADTDNDTVVKW